MNKLLLIFTCTVLLTACAEKSEYREAVLADMTTEKDLKDYNIDPEQMTDCIMDLTGKEMPGAIPIVPERLTAYKNYTKMLSMKTTKDKKASFDELRTIFGSPQELLAAHNNYTKSTMDCINSILMKSEPQTEDGGGTFAPS
ncbi:MAG: hypothetical protein HFP81_00630 [Methylococcales symbiont of Hymedesmia sp. n. MRB-2018]|nr:MAG: hypothetical protein HFP78_02130 [Methylococcales symbiont of Hymedesmia sp. n. MRB-2018]KAF3984742.1 MAG: hypothetical protein HFP81_00630 [Methylococcales symbiont of Hymedesmia sp. n. MRB-2018]